MQSAKRFRSEAGLAVFASLGALTVCFSGPSRSDTTPGVDAATEARVRAALASDPKLLARHIQVSVKNGVVRLGGVVASEQDLQLAERDAQVVPGVLSVENAMELKQPPKSGPH